MSSTNTMVISWDKEVDKTKLDSCVNIYYCMVNTSNLMAVNRICQKRYFMMELRMKFLKNLWLSSFTKTNEGSDGLHMVRCNYMELQMIICKRNFPYYVMSILRTFNFLGRNIWKLNLHIHATPALHDNPK